MISLYNLVIFHQLSLTENVCTVDNIWQLWNDITVQLGYLSSAVFDWKCLHRWQYLTIVKWYHCTTWLSFISCLWLKMFAPLTIFDNCEITSLYILGVFDVPVFSSVQIVSNFLSTCSFCRFGFVLFVLFLLLANHAFTCARVIPPSVASTIFCSSFGYGLSTWSSYHLFISSVAFTFSCRDLARFRKTSCGEGAGTDTFRSWRLEEMRLVRWSRSLSNLAWVSYSLCCRSLVGNADPLTPSTSTALLPSRYEQWLV